MIAIRLFLSLCFLTGLAAGQGDYQQIDLADFVRHPEAYQGRMVEVTAEVISINADANALRLYDAPSKALIGVSLTQLEEAPRRALIRDPIHRLSVYGRAELSGGRLIIDAHSVTARPIEMVGDSSSEFSSASTKN